MKPKRTIIYHVNFKTKKVIIKEIILIDEKDIKRKTIKNKTTPQLLFKKGS